MSNDIKINNRGAIVLILACLEIGAALLLGGMISRVGGASDWIVMGVVVVIVMAIVGAAIFISDDTFVLDGKPFELKRVVLMLTLLSLAGINFIVPNVPDHSGCTGLSIFIVGNALVLWLLSSMYSNGSPIDTIKLIWSIIVRFGKWLGM